MLFARPVRVVATLRRARLVEAGSGGEPAGNPREVGGGAPSHLGLLKMCIILLAAAAGAVPPAADARASRSPVNLSPPSISGTARVGNTLKASDGTWRSSTGSVSISRTWLRCDAAGSRCVSAEWGGSAYYLGSIDAGKRIRLRVTARNAFGSSSATSALTAIVAAPTTPAPTEPAPTVPAPTEPAPTEPAPTTPVYERFAGFEMGNWSEWTQLNTSGGSGSIVTSPVAAGSRAGKLTVNSGSGNKYARGYFDISDWQIGSDHWFGARLYLPVGTYAALQGDMALMRWDNWALANMSQDQFGVWLHGTGTKGNLYLMLNNEQDGVDSILVDPGVKMAEGQWSCLEVRQKLGYDGDAISELWLNGTRLGSSTRQNVNGGRRPVTLGYGIVAVNAGAQTNGLTAYIDQAYTARTRAGC
jgi:hypothetical protein